MHNFVSPTTQDFFNQCHARDIPSDGDSVQNVNRLAGAITPKLDDLPVASCFVECHVIGHDSLLSSSWLERCTSWYFLRLIDLLLKQKRHEETLHGDGFHSARPNISGRNCSRVMRPSSAISMSRHLLAGTPRTRQLLITCGVFAPMAVARALTPPASFMALSIGFIPTLNTLFD